MIVFFIQRLRRAQKGQIDANQGGRVAAANGAQAQVTPSGIVGAGGTMQGKKVVVQGRTLRWEYLQLADKQLFDLILGAANGGGGGNDLGAHGLLVHSPGTQGIHRAFVQPDHGTERAANEMQFVLNDQIRGP